jgi:dihydrodipicolinate synthase/N-acetylneuraminate lyase
MAQSTGEFRGVFPAIITPFTPEGKVNEEAFRKVMEFNIQAGARGFWVCGGSGESVLLDDEERVRIAEISVDQAKGRAKIILHVGAVTTRRTAAMAEQVRKAGVDAICAVPPFFYTPSEEAVIEHYKVVAAAADLPFFVYNLPQSTQVDVTPALMKKIVDNVPQTVGLKHSGPNWNIYMVRRYADMGMATFSGNSGILLPALTMGAIGCIDGPPCVAPEAFVDVYDAYLAGDLKKCEQAMKHATAVAMLCHRPGMIAVLKVLLSARLGIDCGVPRLPIPALGEEQKQEVLREAAQLGILDTP